MRIAALLVLAFAGAPAAGTPLGLAELEAAAARARAAPSAPGPALAGRRFRLTVVPRERGPDHMICDGFPSWGYYADQVLYQVKDLYEVDAIEALKNAFDLRDPAGRALIPDRAGPRYLHLLSVACTFERLPSRLAHGTFGEPQQLQAERQTLVAIAHRGGIATVTRGWQVHTTEAEARALGAGTRVRLSGRLGAWAPGRSIVCGEDRGASTMAVTGGEPLRACLINGRVDLIEFVDAATGRVRAAHRIGPLRTWRR